MEGVERQVVPPSAFAPTNDIAGPVVTDINPGDGTITFGWNAVKHAGQVYRMYWSTDPTFQTDYSYTSTGGTSYTVNGLTNGTKYYFRVAGWDNNVSPQVGTTSWSETVSGTPEAGAEVTTTTVAGEETSSTVAGGEETTTTVDRADKQVIVDNTTPITVPDGDKEIACNDACVESIRTTLGVTGDVYATVAGKKVLLDGKTAIPANGTEVVFSDGADKSVTVALEAASATTDTTVDDSFNNTPADDSSFPWIYVIIAVVVLAGGGYVAATRKKKEQK